MLMQTGLGHWHPPFLTNECHVENYYVTTDMQPKREVEKCFFVFDFLGGVSVC